MVEMCAKKFFTVSFVKNELVFVADLFRRLCFEFTSLVFWAKMFECAARDKIGRLVT